MAVSAPSSLAIDPRLLERLKGIELKSRFLVRGLYHNRHRTADVGASTEFIEHREYRRGDELRTIDWRVFARTDRLHVKVHEMESNMRVHLLLDTSDSMRVPPPSGLPGKLELASAIAGAIALMAASQQDAVGLTAVSEQVEEHIPPRQGQAHLQLLFQHLGRPRGAGGGHFGEALADASGRLPNRGLAFVVGDALDAVEPLAAALRNLRVRNIDVTLIQVLDPHELDFPFDRMTEFRHPESGQRVVGHPAALRSKYLERLTAHLEAVREECRKSQADYLQLSTADDLVKLLPLHFLRRYLGGR